MGLYGDKIAGINEGFGDAKTKLTDLRTKLNNLVVTLSASSSENVTNMTTDLNSYIGKIDDIIDAIDQQLGKMNINAGKFDGWYQLYTSKIGQRYNAEDHYLSGVFNKKYAKVEYNKVFINDNGIIEVDYTVYKKVRRFFGFFNGKWVQVPESEAEQAIVDEVVDGTSEEIIPEMKDFTGGTAT